MDQVSYSLGVLIARNVTEQGFNDIDVPTLLGAVGDVLDGKELKIDTAEANDVIQKYMAEKQAAFEKEQAAKYGDVKNIGAKFLEENGTRSEVTTTASGLQYEVMTEGKGAKPSPNNTVTVHYHGSLIDGSVFDSSVDRGEPASFGVTQVIQGWVEGLQLMTLGSKYKFYIPYDLAYGDRAAGPKIQPFSALVFEVELLDIK